MIAGGAEMASTPLGIAGFVSSRALSTNDNPAEASKTLGPGPRMALYCRMVLVH